MDWASVLIQDKHLHWLDQVAVEKVPSLNCYSDSMILNKAKYVLELLQCACEDMYASLTT